MVREYFLGDSYRVWKLWKVELIKYVEGGLDLIVFGRIITIKK